METTKAVRTYSPTEDAAMQLLRLRGSLRIGEVSTLMLNALRALTKRKAPPVFFADGAYRLYLAGSRSVH